MPAVYPGTVATIAANKQDDIDTITGADGGTTTNVGDHAAHHNKLAEEVVATQTELGPDPSGSWSTVAERFNAFDLKVSARAASPNNVNVTLTAPGATLDGVTLVAGDRIFLKNQTLPAENGLFLWTGAATALTRTTDASSGLLLNDTTLVSVREGVENGDSVWELTSDNPITLGTSPLRWTRVHPALGPDFGVSGQIGRWGMNPGTKMSSYDPLRYINGATNIATGVIKVSPLGWLRAGHSLSSLRFVSNTTAGATLVNQWAGICRASDRKILAISPSAGAAAWAANTAKTFTFTSTFTADQDEYLLDFLMVQATTPPNIFGQGASTGYGTAVGGNFWNGQSNTAQTTPLAVGTILAAFTNANAGNLYCDAA